MELPEKRKTGKLKRRFLDVVKEDMEKLVRGKRTLKTGRCKGNHKLWQPQIKKKGQKKKKN